MKYALLFILGALIAYFLTNLRKDETAVEASHTIAYSIQRLNKLVVAEQNYANFISHKSQKSFLSDLISFDKNLLLKVDVKVQASYDLSQMQIEIDSANETIYIRSSPPLVIETYPDVEFFEMNQSRLNQFSKDDINAIKLKAIQEVEKTIDYSDLEQQAHDQLILNLEDIYLLAKVFDWKIVDSTPFAKELEEKVRF